MLKMEIVVKRMALATDDNTWEREDNGACSKKSKVKRR